MDPFQLPPKVFVIAESRSTKYINEASQLFHRPFLKIGMFPHPSLNPAIKESPNQASQAGCLMMAAIKSTRFFHEEFPRKNGSFIEHVPAEKTSGEKNYPDHSTPPLLTHPTRILDGPTLVEKHARPNLLLPLNK